MEGEWDRYERSISRLPQGAWWDMNKQGRSPCSLCFGPSRAGAYWIMIKSQVLKKKREKYWEINVKYAAIQAFFMKNEKVICRVSAVIMLHNV